MSGFNQRREQSADDLLANFNRLNPRLPSFNRFVGRLMTSNHFPVPAHPAPPAVDTPPIVPVLMSARDHGEGLGRRGSMHSPGRAGAAGNAHGRGDERDDEDVNMVEAPPARPNGFDAGYARGRGHYNNNSFALQYRVGGVRIHTGGIGGLPHGNNRSGRNEGVGARASGRMQQSHDFAVDPRHNQRGANPPAANADIRNSGRGDSNVRPFNVLATVPRNQHREPMPNPPVMSRLNGNGLLNGIAAIPFADNRQEAERLETMERERRQRRQYHQHLRPFAMMPAVHNPTPPVRKFRSKFTKQNDQTPDAATTYAAILKHGIDGFEHFKARFDKS